MSLPHRFRPLLHLPHGERVGWDPFGPSTPAIDGVWTNGIQSLSHGPSLMSGPSTIHRISIDHESAESPLLLHTCDTPAVTHSQRQGRLHFRVYFRCLAIDTTPAPSPTARGPGTPKGNAPYGRNPECQSFVANLVAGPDRPPPFWQEPASENSRALPWCACSSSTTSWHRWGNQVIASLPSASRSGSQGALAAPSPDATLLCRAGQGRGRQAMLGSGGTVAVGVGVCFSGHGPPPARLSYLVIPKMLVPRRQGTRYATLPPSQGKAGFFFVQSKDRPVCLKIRRAPAGMPD
jgi:hypothetical protein